MDRIREINELSLMKGKCWLHAYMLFSKKQRLKSDFSFTMSATERFFLSLNYEGKLIEYLTGRKVKIGARRPGFFYCIQICPDVKPDRIMLGFTCDIDKRLKSYLTHSPTSRLWCYWKAKRKDEKDIIDCLQHMGRYPKVGKECIDVEILEIFFNNCLTLMGNPDGYGRTPPIKAEETRDETPEEIAKRVAYEPFGLFAWACA